MDIFDLSGILSYGFYRKIAILEGSPWHPRMGPNQSRSPTVGEGEGDQPEGAPSPGTYTTYVIDSSLHPTVSIRAHGLKSL